MKLPKEIERYTGGLPVSEVLLGETLARVFSVGLEYYLKVQPLDSSSGAESLLTENEALDWLGSYIEVPTAICSLIESDVEYLLMTAIPGLPACELHANPIDVTYAYADALRHFHDSLEVDGCPFDRRIQRQITECETRTENGLVNTADFDDERQGMTAAEILVELEAGAPLEEDLVVAHGDYCMPNVLFGENLALTGFIDLGRAGIADWHSDLALATRSITRNLGKTFVEPFYKRYGKQPDMDRLGFYLMLDEFF
jgi:aminoglycoside 3'-phosphotransferase-2